MRNDEGTISRGIEINESPLPAPWSTGGNPQDLSTDIDAFIDGQSFIRDPRALRAWKANIRLPR